MAGWLVFIILFGLTPCAQAVSPAVAVAVSQQQSPSVNASDDNSKPTQDQQKAAYAALATLLQNDRTRQALINQLRQASAPSPADAVPALVPSVAAAQDNTVLDNVTGVSRRYAGEFSAKIKQLSDTVFHSPHKAFNPQTFFTALNHFLMLAVSLFGFYLLICRLASPLYRLAGRWGRQKKADHTSWLQLPVAILGAFIIDLLLLALALLVGQFLSNALNAGNRTIMHQQGLFLNAFALIEFFKAVLRLIFCPRFPDLRPFHLPDTRARYWNTHLSWLSGLIGYGLLVVVPIIANQINQQAAVLANVVIMSVITLWAIWLILHNRRNIQRELNQLADRSMRFFAFFIRAFAFVWHWLACIYFVTLFFLSLFNPGNSLQFMVAATVRTLVTIFIGALVAGILTRWMGKNIVLSAELQRHYPELQKRVNGWLKMMLKLARTLTVFSVILLLLNAWQVFDLWHWLSAGPGERLVDVTIRIVLILFLSAAGWTLLASLIENRLASDSYGRPMPGARTRTLLTLFRNALAVIISTITIMILLSEIGVNIAPLLAGAGALGLAISFGSQTLVKDIITGVFIQFENGMNTGDLVTIGAITGTVERMSIRSVGVRQDTGAYHIIPWSSITTFANFVRGIGSFVANYDVDRGEDVERVNQTLQAAVSELMENQEIRAMVIGQPAFAGLVGLSDRAFTVRVSFTTQPLKQWTVRFALDGMVKKHFDAADIQAPHQTVQVMQTGSDASFNAAGAVLPAAE
ncbi:MULTISPECIES: mechanosensitive channel protein [unclassified Erwinia]|uniref:mechanosensitive channel protein n=1 Tax=unclassified Erwinia TaxID=2622719 RepID=UPI001F53B30D|nr:MULTISPECIES: mechanosensitive channel protein [unclassified Erwinia]